MWGTIAAEGSDGFDAISRSYSYAFQRPLQYLGYAILAIGFGILGWLVVFAIIQLVMHFCIWMTSWSAGERWSRINEARKGLESDSWITSLGVYGIDLGFRFARSIQSAFAYAYFWTASSAIYLLLRNDTDRTEFDDIYLIDDERNALSLPTLGQDESGIPKVSDH
jgi:hypothetical protein